MATASELTLVERFEKHAASKSEATRVYSRVKDYAIMDLTLNELLSIPGIGRKAAILVLEVAADLKNKK